jgi:amino acid transporter
VMPGRSELSSWTHWVVVVVALLLIGLSLFTNYRLVRKLLYNLY